MESPKGEQEMTLFIAGFITHSIAAVLAYALGWKLRWRCEMKTLELESKK
jgi:hypothetical protein